MNRREAIATMTTTVITLSGMPGSSAEGIAPLIVADHDVKLQETLNRQVTDLQSPWRGGIPDQWGLHHCGAAARLLRDGIAAFIHPQSRFHRDETLLNRIELAAGFLDRSQGPDGNIDLITTNFNSPPDTGFVVHDVATAAKLAQMHQAGDLLSLMGGFLRRAGDGMVRGGIHTPNHRWVVCAALAQIHDLFPNEAYVKRIDEWLAEGIDIDAEGQFTERSTTVYNAVTDNALVVTAHKLKRPELLDSVRKNLTAMIYLLHPNGEVVTEISNRQDVNMRGTMARYWFALRYLAARDRDGLYTSMLVFLEPAQIQLAALMEYPELQQDLPQAKPLPQRYVKHYPFSNVTRIRRGQTSITIMRKQNSRWISIHHGQAVIQAIRFASAFFGKGQFVPAFDEERKEGFYFRQELEGQYYQPFETESLLPIRHDNWSRLRGTRRRTEICRLVYEATIFETPEGLDLGIAAHGTENVPLAIEINLRANGKTTGVTPVPGVDEVFLLKDGFAQFQAGEDVIRFGPGRCEHSYTQVRGAHSKLPGPSVYLTGFTPFQYTLKMMLQTNAGKR